MRRRSSMTRQAIRESFAPQRRVRRTAGFAVALAALLLAGCAQTTAFKSAPEIELRGESPRVLLMPADIELSELSAGGISFPKAEWTEAANQHVTAALDEFLRERNAELVAYAHPTEGSEMARRHTQLIKLHGAVGNTVLIHKFMPPLALPTKEDKFDWTLGKGARALRDAHDADYALFVFIRDSYSSGGRVMVIMIGALLGVGVPGGVQVGFASLVDLETGDVVWFNRLISETGDLRTPEPARRAVDNLLADFPL